MQLMEQSKKIGSYDKELTEIKTQISIGVQKSNQIIDKVNSLIIDEKDSMVELP